MEDLDNEYMPYIHNESHGMLRGNYGLVSNSTAHALHYNDPSDNHSDDNLFFDCFYGLGFMIIIVPIMFVIGETFIFGNRLPTLSATGNVVPANPYLYHNGNPYQPRFFT
jgi:hypothetical protein